MNFNNINNICDTNNISSNISNNEEKSKISKFLKRKQTVKFEDTTNTTTNQFNELLQEILETKSSDRPINNNTNNNLNNLFHYTDKYILGRIRLMSKKLYDVKGFDISEFYNSYENSDMEKKDQTNFYDNVSDFIFGYGESWKLLTQEEYDYYDNIIFYRYDSYFDFEGTNEPLLLNLFTEISNKNGNKNSNISNNITNNNTSDFILKFNLSSITDTLRIEGFIQLFDTKTHKLCYNNNTYGDLFVLIDNIVMVEIRKRLHNIPKELIETWFENHTLDSDTKVEEYVYKYVDKHGWLNTNCFYLFKSIEFIHKKMNEIMESYTKYSSKDMVKEIYSEICKNVQESIMNYKTNFDTVLIELQSKASLYKKEEMIQLLSQPLNLNDYNINNSNENINNNESNNSNNNIQLITKEDIIGLDHVEPEDIFKEVKFLKETDNLLKVDFDSEDAIENYKPLETKSVLDNLHEDRLMKNKVLNKIIVEPVYKNIIDIDTNDPLFKLSAKSKYYTQFSSKSSLMKEECSRLDQLAQSTKEKIDFVYEFINNFTDSGKLQHSNILFIIIYIHANVKEDLTLILSDYKSIEHPIIEKWNIIIKYIQNM